MSEMVDALPAQNQSRTARNALTPTKLLFAASASPLTLRQMGNVPLAIS
jgi:hypothetical protein